MRVFFSLFRIGLSSTSLDRRNIVFSFYTMARTYSRKKGKARSHKPVDKTVPEWVGYQANEVEQLIVKFAKQGKTSSEIGLLLRDSYGIPSVQAMLNKSIVTIMKEKKLTKKLPEDLMNLIQRHIAVMRHAGENKRDMVALRGVQLTESHIKRLITYYKAKKVLPGDFIYDKTRAKLYLE